MDFESNATEETKNYFGHNTGTPWTNPKGDGLLSGKNLMQMPCSDTKKQTPYFLDWESTNHNEFAGKFKDTDDFLFSHLNNLSDTVMDISLRNVEGNVDVDALPDGVYRV